MPPAAKLTVVTVVSKLSMSMCKDPTLYPTPSCHKFLGSIMETCHQLQLQLLEQLEVCLRMMLTTGSSLVSMSQTLPIRLVLLQGDPREVADTSTTVSNLSSSTSSPSCPTCASFREDIWECVVPILLHQPPLLLQLQLLHQHLHQDLHQTLLLHPEVVAPMPSV